MSTPRKLVISFEDGYSMPLAPFMIQGDQNGHSQLLHRQQFTGFKKPSRIDRLASHLRPRRGSNSLIDENLTGAYSFLFDNYQPGDTVVFLVSTHYSDHTSMNAAEILAEHIREGTRPGDYSELQPSHTGEVPGKQIPIHCLAARFNDNTKSISVLSDQLKSRFPPGIERVICWGKPHHNDCSCSTIFDSDGSIISREICFYDDPISDLDIFVNSTRDVVYYQPNVIPSWNQPTPIWAQALSPPMSHTQCITPLESAEPVGMYRHELRKYQGLDEWQQSRYAFCPTKLVWKSSRH